MRGVNALTILHLGPQLALFGVLKEGLMLSLPHYARLIAAGLIKESPISTRCGARKQMLPKLAPTLREQPGLGRSR